MKRILPILFFLASIASAQVITRAYIVDGSVRLKKTIVGSSAAIGGMKMPDSLRKGYPWNSAWDTISTTAYGILKGARNEYVPFQIIIENDTTGTSSNVWCRFDSLRKSYAPTYTIKNLLDSATYAADLRNQIGKNIQMFVEHYQYLPDGSYRSKSSSIWSGTARPGYNNGVIIDPIWKHESYFYGYQPEILIPIETRTTNASGTAYSNGQGGQPFSIAARQNQAVWVDVYIPDSCEAGDYYGTVKVYQNTTLRVSIPIWLHVIDWTMSDTSHFNTVGLFSMTNLKQRYSIDEATDPVAFWGLAKQFSLMGYAHRLNGRFVVDSTRFKTYWGNFYKGLLFNPDSLKYTLWGSGLGKRPNYYLVGAYTFPTKVPGGTHPPPEDANELLENGWYQFPSPGGGDFFATVDKGNWDSAGVTYNVNDVVYRAGDYYPNWFWCQKTHVSNGTNGPVKNTSTQYWNRLTHKGSDISFVYSPDTTVEKANFQGAVNFWGRWFAANAPTTRLGWYGPEESGIEDGDPDTSAFASIRRYHRWMTTNPSGVSFETRIATVLDGAKFGKINYVPDIVASINGRYGGNVVYKDSVQRHIAAGQTWEVYGGTIPNGPVEVFDAPGAMYRAMIWMARYNGASSLNVDDGTNWYTSNVFALDQHSYSGGAVIKNGDGSILYPGSDKLFPNDSRRLDVPLASIRLKNLRQGVQDMEYVREIIRLGYDSTSYFTRVAKKYSEITNSYIPIPAPPNGWAQRGAEYDSVKWLMGELIEMGSPLPSGAIVADEDSLPLGGGTVKISWESFNTVSASLSIGDSSVSVSTYGFINIDLTTTTLFTIYFSNSTGTTSYSVTVNVAATPGASGTLTVKPDTLPPGGGAIEVAWSVMYADSVKLVRSGGDTVTVAAHSSRIDTVTTKGLKEWYLLMYDSEGEQIVNAEAYVRPYRWILPFRKRD